MRFEWIRKAVDLDPHPIVGHVIQAEDVEKFPHALGFQNLDLFFFFLSQQAGSMFDSHGEGGWR